MAVDAVGMPYYDPAGALEFAGKALEPWCEQASRRNIGCDALLREGNPALQLAAVVRQFQADRILLGSRSRNKLGQLLLGSVAEQVLRSINLPIFTVGPEAYLAAADAGQEPVVLYATTLREASRPSAALACRIAASQGATLVLLHVLPPMDEMEKRGLAIGQESTALHELRILAAEAGAGCCSKVEAHVVHGNPTIEILALSSERHASLIMLGASQRSALENLTRDRTIYRVLAHARCPVLTLKEPLFQGDKAHLDQMAFRH
jgi:nucleotide-binding universal stress UspA family protein